MPYSIIALAALAVIAAVGMLAIARSIDNDEED
jgi:hypothetical protein